MKLAFFLIAVTASRAAWGQAAQRFDSATIVPGLGTGAQRQLMIQNGRLAGTNVTLKEYVSLAYELPPSMIFGGPGWMNSDRFDIRAIGDARLSDHEVMMMLRQLLATRFELVANLETRQMQAHVLEAAKGGLKLIENSDQNFRHIEGRGHLILAPSLDRLAQSLTHQLNMPVINGTGIVENSRVKLAWENSLDKALDQQLGLRMRTAKMPVEVVVVRHAEKPVQK